MSKKEIFLVGGAVRDKLINQTLEKSKQKSIEEVAADLDYVVVNSSPEEMISLGYENVGKDFPVFLHPETKDEHALARKERKSGQGYTGFETDWKGVTLEEDLFRRDLTINAMAEDQNGNVIDPYGGRADIKSKKLRHVSEAFKEDPVRILRVARFASRMPEFTVANETMAFMQEMVKDGMVNELVSERVWKEWHRAMKSEAPHRFFEVLRDTGALEVLFPVIHNMIGVPQRADYHAEGDVFIHTMMVLKEATELTKDFDEDRMLLIRMGALLHDVGKTKTSKDLLFHKDGSMKGSHTGHDNSVVVKPLLKELQEKYKLPDFVHRFCLDVAVFHQRFHAINNMKKTSGWTKLFEELKPRQKADENGEDRYLEDLLITCKADAIGRLMTVDGKIVPAKRNYTQADLIIEKYEQHKKDLLVVGKFFSLVKEHKVKVNPKEFPRIKMEVLTHSKEGKNFGEILVEILSKEQKHNLREKGVDIPLTNSELKKNIKREAIEKRKAKRAKNKI
tara:strand:- start:6061 stop:7581 length:1521 start_codon:yes stop_codon:yes gene_type:complete